MKNLKTRATVSAEPAEHCNREVLYSTVAFVSKLGLVHFLDERQT